MEPIRILHVLQRMEPAGVQTLLMNIYREIDKSKIQFDFLVHYETPQFFDEEIEKLGGKIYRLSIREDYNFLKYFMDLNNFFKNHNEYKIIHGHMHSLGFIYLYFAKKYNIPIRIAHSHTNSTQKDLKKIPKIIMNKLFSKNATHLFACSKLAGEYMFGKKKFEIINNAIDSEKFIFNYINRENIRNELNLNNNFVLGVVGRFEIQKNQKFAIILFEELLKRHPSAKMIMVGTGSMLEEVKFLAKEKKIENNVLFLGNRKDMPKIYHSMDAFLFPSLFEGLGIVGVEAQAAGIPVICTDTLPEEINVTPLIYRVSLNSKVAEWIDVIDKSQKNKFIHKDMSKFVYKNNYDIKNTVDFLQTFYLKNS